MAIQTCNGDSVELRVPCKPEYVRTVRTLIAEIADSVPLSPQDIEEVKVAASEAVANIVRHAYGNSADSAPVIVRCCRSNGMLVVEIIDRGIGFCVPAASEAPPPDVSRKKEGGLGIILIRNLMDSVDYWSQPNLGTRIRMTKSRWHNRRNQKKRELLQHGAGF
ncbi:MAG TPA: ATP-binding protein [Armatimonadota bacterium]|mgnify:CR=1 FL=1|nr:ATP-binding protein [Armatimonadota bacterium]